MRDAQENLRLSTGQIGRLTAEFKSNQTQNEELKSESTSLMESSRRTEPKGESKVTILKQECERLNSLVERT